MPKKKTLKVKVFDAALPKPQYMTKGAVAFDVYLREKVSIRPHAVELAPVNIATQIPKGHFAMLAGRSSLHKMGVMMANGIGIVDEDYCGDEDEYKMALLNFTSKKVSIKAGERIGQVMLIPYTKATIQIVKKLGNPSRGGFGRGWGCGVGQIHPSPSCPSP